MAAVISIINYSRHGLRIEMYHRNQPNNTAAKAITFTLRVIYNSYTYL